MGGHTQIAHLLTEATNAGERGTAWSFEAHVVYQGFTSRGRMYMMLSMIMSRLTRGPGLDLCVGRAGRHETM